MNTPRRVGAGRISASTRVFILDRDEGTCQNCGQRPPDVVIHVDHIVPVAAGGSDTPDNLAVLCAACNLGKGQRTDLSLAALRASRHQAEAKRAESRRQLALARVAKELSEKQRREQELIDLEQRRIDLERQRREEMAKSAIVAEQTRAQRERDAAIHAAAQAHAKAVIEARSLDLYQHRALLMSTFGLYLDHHFLLSVLNTLSLPDILSTVEWVNGLPDVEGPKSRWNIARKALQTRALKASQRNGHA